MNRRWAVVALIFFGILISYVDRGNLSIAAPTILKEFQLSPVAMGVLLSSFFWTYGLFQIPAGMLVDSLGIRRVYALAFVVWSVSSAALALSRGWPDMLALRLLLGLAESVGPLASLAYIRRNFSDREKGTPTAIYIAGQTIGPGLGALLGTILLAHYGWRAMFVITGLGALLWVVPWLLLAPRDRSPAPVPVRTASVHVGPDFWLALLKHPAFWALSLSVFFFAYYWYFILTWIPTYLTISRGFSTLEMGRILSTPLFAMAVVNVAGGWAADRFVARGAEAYRVRLWFAGAGLTGAVAIILLNVVTQRALVLPILVISICSFGVANSNLWTLAQQTAPGAQVGRVLGYLNTISQIGGVTAPLITGWILEPSRNFGPAITIAALTPLAACVLLWFAGPKGLGDLRAMLSTATAAEAPASS